MEHRQAGRRTAIAVVVAILAACTSAPVTSIAPGTSPSTAALEPGSTNVSPTAVTMPSPSPTAAPAVDRNPAAYVEDEPYVVSVDPADFVAVVDNPYWPLAAGTTTVLEGDGERIVVEVTDYSKVILGVTTTVVRDRAYEDGRLIEDTLDWYAQDRWGNVWYFGEETTEYENGTPVSTAGSWEAGVDGARPGIVMLAQPHVGDVYRNEYYVGEAEDLSKVIALDGTLTVPLGAFEATVTTEDWTPLEPSQLERKVYAPGVGLIAEGPVDDPLAIELVEFRKP
jgi:hypothetical protein